MENSKMIAFTHHCGVCGDDIVASVALEGCRIQFVIPPCKTCYDDAMAQGEAKAIVKQITKGKDDESIALIREGSYNHSD
jgi:hypothetical protein